MIRAQRSVFIRIVTWILLIQIVNISIDPTDPATAVDSLVPYEDLSINDIESIYELVSEQYLGVDVPEQDEDDENGFLKVFDFYFSDSSIRIKPNYAEVKAPKTCLTEAFSSILLDHTSPPPRVS